MAWYQKQKIGGRSYWRKEFKKAARGIEETYDIYRLRLVELAKLAFPASKTECARQLRSRFFALIDGAISQRIADAELAYRMNPACSAKYMPFSSIVDMATELQRSTKNQSTKTQTIMWTSGPPATQSVIQQPTLSQQGSIQQATRRRRSFSRNLAQSSRHIGCH